MTREEKIALAVAALLLVGIIWYHRSATVQSGVKPLLVEEANRLAALGDMIVGESNTLGDPSGVAYLTSNVPWGWPLPSMLPQSAGPSGNSGQPI